MISYYDILTLIKNGIIPREIILYFFGESDTYYFDGENTTYLLKEAEKENDNFKLYLNECLNELDSLDKHFKIVTDKKALLTRTVLQ